MIPIVKQNCYEKNNFELVPIHAKLKAVITDETDEAGRFGWLQKKTVFLATLGKHGGIGRKRRRVARCLRPLPGYGEIRLLAGYRNRRCGIWSHFPKEPAELSNLPEHESKEIREEVTTSRT